MNNKEMIMKTYGRYNLNITHGHDCYLVDSNGNEYLDFVAGIAVNSLGYSNTVYKENLKAQVDKILHISNLYWHDNMLNAANLLIKYSGMDQVFFCNSGSEAIETSIKLARIYAKRNIGLDKFEIISMKNSFHGRTMGALTLTGQAKYQREFTPMLPGVRYADYNDIESLKNVLTDNTCAVIIEVVQGEGGIIPIDEQYAKDLSALCKKLNLLLIVDEIQTGVGRLGTFYGFQSFGLKPDIVASAKGLGNGFPVGACLATKKVADAFQPGNHGNTFGGNPLATCAIISVVTEVMENKLIDNVVEVSAYLINKLNMLKEKYSFINTIRGKGLMLGIVVDSFQNEIIDKCIKKGLLLVGAGPKVIRVVPPLVVTKKDIDKAINILDSVLSDF